MRAHRPIGTLLLLWPTLWALWLAADGTPPMLVLVIFVLGTFFMRSAGCVINDLADRNFDGHVARTKDRPLVMGWVTPRVALTVFVVLVTLSAVTVLPIMTPLLFVLSLIAVFLAASYPFTKRFLAIPQGYLGIAFGFGQLVIGQITPFRFGFTDQLVPLAFDDVFIHACSSVVGKVSLATRALL